MRRRRRFVMFGVRRHGLGCVYVLRWRRRPFLEISGRAMTSSFLCNAVFEPPRAAAYALPRKQREYVLATLSKRVKAFLDL